MRRQQGTPLAQRGIFTPAADMPCVILPAVLTCSSLRLRPTVVPMVLITPGRCRAVCPATEDSGGSGWL